MNIDELKSKITFRDEPVGNLRRTIATLQVNAYHIYRERPDDTTLLTDMRREQLRKNIIRTLYDDRQRLLYEALDACMSANPTDFGAVREAREKLLKAAKFQPFEL